MSASKLTAIMLMIEPDQTAKLVQEDRAGEACFFFWWASLESRTCLCGCLLGLDHTGSLELGTSLNRGPSNSPFGGLKHYMFGIGKVFVSLGGGAFRGNSLK